VSKTCTVDDYALRDIRDLYLGVELQRRDAPPAYLRC
jgi:hypothetical protein